jgi:ribonuclease HII
MRVAGVDEVGRGPLAGPVVAAAVVFPADYRNPEIKDSKKLTARKRESLVETIKRDALEWSIVAVGPRRIERLNIREASRLAMKLAVERVQADLIRVDGNTSIDVSVPQETIIGGDRLFLEISAASIIAKVWRDQLMENLSRKYPGYGFEMHAGYPTLFHKQAISRLGPSVIHRCTFSGVREFSIHASPISPS